MPVTALLGLSWGDEGKGRVVDFLAPSFDVIVRFNGGPNAGHTVMVEDRTFRFHLLPSGMLYPDKTCVIANGVVLDLEGLKKEYSELRDYSPRLASLYISDRAHLILPYHPLLDSLEEKARGKSKIGTTGKGIGPVHADKFSRKGMRVCDLFHPNYLKERLSEILEEKNLILTKIYGEKPLVLNELYEGLLRSAEFLKPFVRDTALLLQSYLKAGKSLLMEGAQGALLDHEFGTYPYVTSTSPMAGMISLGSGVGPHQIDCISGVIKAYTTRVGAGPFPTELEGDLAEYLRERGGEYGTTTGRPRRCGWLDLPLTKYVLEPNSIDSVILTKLDVLTGLKEIKVCIAYGSNHSQTQDVPALAKDLEKMEPVYKTLPGWQEEISQVKNFNDLPLQARNYIQFLEEALAKKITLISVGPSREQMIER